MGRRLAWLLVLVLALALAGCGGDGESSDTTAADTGDTAASETTEASGETSAATDEKVTLKVVSAWAENNSMNDGLRMLQEKVQETSGGSVEIVWGGGPESIPSQQLAEALRNGVTDMAWTAHTYNVSQIPVLEGAKLTKLLPEQEREAGVADFYNGLYEEKMNVHYLGAGTPGLSYNLYMTEEVASSADFKGKSVRVTPAYKAFAAALGAAPVTTDPGEVYTALERNMVVGYGWPSVGIGDFGWDEVTKFVVEPAFYQVDVVGLVGLDAWEKLSVGQQEALTEAAVAVEQEAYDYFQTMMTEDRAKLVEAGIKEVQLSDADAYLDTAYEAAWEVVTAADAANAEELRSMIDQ